MSIEGDGLRRRRSRHRIRHQCRVEMQARLSRAPGRCAAPDGNTCGLERGSLGDAGTRAESRRAHVCAVSRRRLLLRPSWLSRRTWHSLLSCVDGRRAAVGEIRRPSYGEHTRLGLPRVDGQRHGAEASAVTGTEQRRRLCARAWRRRLIDDGRSSRLASLRRRGGRGAAHLRRCGRHRRCGRGEAGPSLAAQGARLGMASGDGAEQVVSAWSGAAPDASLTRASR